MARNKRKSDFLRPLGILWQIWTALVNEVLELDGGDDDLRLIETDAILRRELATLIVNRRAKPPAPVPYFLPLTDSMVPAKHQPILVKYRLLAADHGVPTTTPVCYKVTAGFTLKTHAPKAGPCHDNFSYLQNWDFQDEPTADCFVFLLPRLLFTGKTKNQQIKLLSDLRAKLELPAHHLSGFGKATLVTGLILAHFKATGERIPLNNYWVRTDTCRAVGNRLNLGSFGGSGLHCNGWDFDASSYGGLGVFALGVELGN